jgi:hypothetical protein
LEELEDRRLPATFLVTTAGDNGNNTDPLAGSLRAAILAADANPGLDFIQFQIAAGPQTILLATDLPAITVPVVIDGTSQPGFTGSPLIELNGNGGIAGTGLAIMGGSSTVSALVIDGFSGPGIHLSGRGSDIVQGSYIGTDPTGMAAPGNGGAGIEIDGVIGNTIGGTTTGLRNVISGNGGAGILIHNTNSARNLVEGNFIGTDVTGTKFLGNGGDGISLQSGPNNTIGGTIGGAVNVIAGNRGNGVTIDGTMPNAPSSSTVVQANFIGVAADGVTALANAGGGVFITSASGNFIGGEAAGAGNSIAFNGGAGVAILSGTADAVLGNAIFSNKGLGIDLGNDGVTLNDSKGHTGPNNYQDFPVLTSAVLNNGVLTVKGTLSGTPTTSYAIQLFAIPSCDPSGFGQGQNPLSIVTAATDISGQTSFTAQVTTTIPAGTAFITATATDPNDNTSEFSQCLALRIAGTLTVDGTTAQATEGLPFTGVTVATLTDTDNDPPASYSATITWGDGTNSAGAFQPNPGGGLAVTGGHTYAEEGSYPVAVIVVDNDGSTATVQSTAQVADAALSGIPVAVTSKEATTFNGIVATFTDADPAGTVSDYTATISWGDGHNSPGIIKAGSSGGFTVSGTNAYAPGVFTFTVTVSDAGGAAVAINGTATVVPIYSATGADAGGGSEVKVTHALTGAVQFDFLAYGPFFLGGVRVAIGDVNGDGIPDIITAPGPGGGPDIRIWDGVSGNLIGEFAAYDPFFMGGVYVAVGDVNGDGHNEIITGPDQGGGPDVRVFSGLNGTLIGEFLAYGPFFQGGVRVAVGDVNGDGTADIITGAGPGGGPHVQAFSGAGGPVLMSFLAYNSTFTGGVYVATADVNGDGKADVITGPGVGAKPNVKVFRGSDGTVILSFLAYDSNFLGGVRVAGVSDLNGDGHDDLLTGAGPGGGPNVEAFDGLTAAVLDNYLAYAAPFTGGVFVGGH